MVFESVRRLAMRIKELAARYPMLSIKMLKGHVKGAFKHIPVSWRLARHFAGSYRHELTVVDLSLPFGWTGSPAHYGALGGGISFIVARESPNSLNPAHDDTEPLFSFVWVDDHVLIEVDRGDRLELAEAALRLSMLAMLGPWAINVTKFSSWETKLNALGLIWDTQLKTVSMPEDRIQKTLLRISDAIAKDSASKHQLAQLLGSLRHVGLCFRAARAFVQRIHGLWVQAPAFGTVKLSEDVVSDLAWTQAILPNGGVNSAPTSIVANSLAPAIHLFMDARDEGLCVLYPAANEFIRVRFDDAERQCIVNDNVMDGASFNINVREALSVVYASLVWGPRWSHLAQPRHPVHVRCWIDNMSAVAWVRKHHSRNVFGQELNRVLSCAEMVYGLHISTAHLEGATNILADLGSRGWSGHKLAQWTDRVSAWTEQTVPSKFRKIYAAESSNCRSGHSPTHLTPSIIERHECPVSTESEQPLWVMLGQ